MHSTEKDTAAVSSPSTVKADLKPDHSPVLYTEERPWGSFTVLEDLPHCKVKRLIIHPGHRLSLQMHFKREEHWTVVRGKPSVTIGETTQTLAISDHVHIPKETRHRIANEGHEDAEIIEVQLGEYFGEDDIVRFEDDYNRV